MIAAIYARKSTDQRGVATEDKSVSRQIELARAFATVNGWTVSDAHIYADDGFSGAEFEKRPGLQRLLADALTGRTSPFAVVIVSEQKSIGREVNENGSTIKRLAQAHVEIFEYVHGRSLTPKNWIDKLTGTVLASIDEGHRVQTAERVHEAFSAKHSRGHVVGGQGVRLQERPRVQRHRRIWKSAEVTHAPRTGSRGGTRGAAHLPALRQAARVSAPSPSDSRRKAPPRRNHLSGKIRRRSSRSTVGHPPRDRRDFEPQRLHRRVHWNRSKKRDQDGKQDQHARPAAEWQSVAIPEWRIVPDDVWQRVRERRKDVEGKACRLKGGRLAGRPPQHGANNMLAGLATCGVCGGGIVVDTTRNGHGPRKALYVCHRRRAFSGCSNALRVSVEALNEAVLQEVERHVLTPEAVESVITATERDDRQEQAAALRKERQGVANSIANLVAALKVGIGGDVPSVVAEIRTLEARQRAIDDELANYGPCRASFAVVHDRLTKWRRLLRASTTQARAVLQRIIVGRITFTPHVASEWEMPGGYDFEARTRFDKLFAGVATPMSGDGRDLTGTEGITRADTYDADYARILERAQKRLENSQRGMCGVPGRI